MKHPMRHRRLYLDTANWIDMAEGRVDSGPFEQAIADARVVPVLALPHLLDLARNPSEAGRTVVADYIDSIGAFGPIKWIKHSRDIIRREATACFKEMFRGRWESPVGFFDSFHDTLPGVVPEIVMTVGEGFPRRTAEMLDHMVENDQFQKYLADCSGYPALRRRIVRMRGQRGAKKRFTNAEKRAWLGESLPEHVNMTAGTIPINDDLKRKFVESVDLSKCPAFRANWAFHEGSNLDPGSARPSDIADLWHLTGVAYCDVAFADRKTVEVLRKGKYDKPPKRNPEFVEWIRGLA